MRGAGRGAESGDPYFIWLVVILLAAFGLGLLAPRQVPSASFVSDPPVLELPVPASFTNAPAFAETRARAPARTALLATDTGSCAGVNEPSPDIGRLPAVRVFYRDVGQPVVRALDPSIALVIDDLGSSAEITSQAAALPKAVSLSFLPGPDSAVQSLAARAAGHEILLHLPLEPVGGVSPGRGALYVRDSAAVIAAKLAQDLALVPEAVGVNNHMGSRFTADADAMRRLIGALKGRHLIFLDSRTSTMTLAAGIAERGGIATAERRVFLDHETQGTADVEANLRAAEALARAEGSVVVIGHPHAATLAVLKAWLPGAAARGVALISMTEHVRRTRGQSEPRVALMQLRASAY